MLKITVLGSGTAVSDAFPSGYLLEVNERKYLIDSSEGIRHRLKKAGVNFFDISSIIISHFHPDHFNTETLIQSLAVDYAQKKSPGKLTIFGPPETEKRLISIWDAKHEKNHFKKSLVKNLKVTVIEYQDQVPIKLDDISIIPFKTDHVPYMPCYSLRFEIMGKVISYSGDSAETPGLLKSCANADLSILDCNNPPGKTDSGHLNPLQASRVAMKSNVRQLVLTHHGEIENEKAFINEALNGGFENPVKIARDFDVLQLENA